MDDNIIAYLFQSYSHLPKTCDQIIQKSPDALAPRGLENNWAHTTNSKPARALPAPSKQSSRWTSAICPLWDLLPGAVPHPSADTGTWHAALASPAAFEMLGTHTTCSVRNNPSRYTFSLCLFRKITSSFVILCLLKHKQGQKQKNSPSHIWWVNKKQFLIPTMSEVSHTRSLLWQCPKKGTDFPQRPPLLASPLPAGSAVS